MLAALFVWEETTAKGICSSTQEVVCEREARQRGRVQSIFCLDTKKMLVGKTRCGAVRSLAAACATWISHRWFTGHSLHRSIPNRFLKTAARLAVMGSLGAVVELLQSLAPGLAGARPRIRTASPRDSVGRRSLIG